MTSARPTAPRSTGTTSRVSCYGTATSCASGTQSWCSNRTTNECHRVNSPLALQLLRFGFLALLWLFVLAAVRVVRSDLKMSGQPRVSVAPPARRRGRKPPPAPRAHGPSHLLVTEGGLAGTRIGLTGAPVL